MRGAILVLALACLPALAAISADPAGCASSGGVISVHPCTVTSTFAGASATAGEIAEIQAVFDSAHRGDTLVTPAKDIATCTLSIKGTNLAGAADAYFTWKTEHYDARFPASGVRVTQPYRPLMTRVICNGGGGSRALSIRGRLSRAAPAVADGIDIRGIAFIGALTGTTYASGLVQVGENAVYADVTDEATTTTDYLTYSASAADLAVWHYSAAVTIKRNGATVDAAEYTWEPWYNRVTFLVAQQPTDTITMSGRSFTTTLPAHQPKRIMFRHVLIDGEGDLDRRLHNRLLLLHSGETHVLDSHVEGAATISGDSQSIAGWGGPGPHVILNNYVGGATENYMNGGATNTLGPANTADLTYGWNYNPQESWQAFSYRASNTWYRKGTIVRQESGVSADYLATTTGVTGADAPTWDATEGALTTDGTVTWKRLPTGRQHRVVKNNLELKEMVRATIRFNHFRDMWAADQACSVNFKAENSNAGTSPHIKTTDVWFASNVIESGYCALNVSTNQVGPDALGRMTIENNLWRGFANNRSFPGANPCALSHMNFGGQSNLANYFRNNLVDAWAAPDAPCGASGGYTVNSDGQGNWMFRDNIVTRTGGGGSRPGFWGYTSGETEGSLAIRMRYQGLNNGSLTTPVPPGRWTHNIVSGAPPNKYPNTSTGDTGNVNWETARDAIGFYSASSGYFRLKPDSPYITAGYTGGQLGPDWSRLALMHGFTVQATDRAALFTWTMSPVHTTDMACVVEVGARDLLSFVADLDPATYLKPGIDTHDSSVRYGRERMLLIGSRVALTPDTEYGYRIQCPGYTREGWFRTSAALSGTATKTVAFDHDGAGTPTVTYGTTYSRASGVISGGDVATVECAGGRCTASWTATRGQAYYYQLPGRPVQAVVIH